MAVMSGLNNSSIQRLKDYWSAVPEKQIRTFKKYEQIMDNMGNFKSYREFLSQEVPPTKPCIPYIALHLRDVFFAIDSNELFTEHERLKLVNFEALKITGESVSKLMQFQLSKYNLQCDSEIHSYFTQLQCLDEEELYQKSVECRPLAGEEPPKKEPQEGEIYFDKRKSKKIRDVKVFNNPLLKKDAKQQRGNISPSKSDRSASVSDIVSSRLSSETNSDESSPRTSSLTSPRTSSSNSFMSAATQSMELPMKSMSASPPPTRNLVDGRSPVEKSPIGRRLVRTKSTMEIAEKPPIRNIKLVCTHNGVTKPFVIPSDTNYKEFKQNVSTVFNLKGVLLSSKEFKITSAKQFESILESNLTEVPIVVTTKEKFSLFSPKKSKKAVEDDAVEVTLVMDEKEVQTKVSSLQDIQESAAKIFEISTTGMSISLQFEDKLIDEKELCSILKTKKSPKLKVNFDKK